MQIERVLLTHDPRIEQWDETLFSTARAIAGPADATVYVLALFSEDESEEMRKELDVDSGFGTLSPDDLAARVDGIQPEIDRFEAQNIGLELRGVSGGEPAEQILRRIETLNVDLALVSGEERSPAGKALFGDLAQTILRQAPVPVVYVRQGLDEIAGDDAS